MELVNQNAYWWPSSPMPHTCIWDNARADIMGPMDSVTKLLFIISIHTVGYSVRISFKLAVMTYRSIHGTSPSYLQSCCTRVADMTSRRRLRSSTSHRPDVPPIRLSTVGKRAFPVSGATVWNVLPLHVASAPSLAVFRQRLETFPFSRSYQDTIIFLVCYCYHSSLLFVDTCGPCNMWHYLGHITYVYDDDDDDLLFHINSMPSVKFYREQFIF